MNSYPHIVESVPGTMKILSANEVRTIKVLAGKVSQNGIKYANDGVVVLQTNNQYNILDAFKNGCWAHSCKPTRVTKGTIVYVVPSNPCQEEFGEGAIGLQFVAKNTAYQDHTTTLSWSSNVDLQANQV